MGCIRSGDTAAGPRATAREARPGGPSAARCCLGATRRVRVRAIIPPAGRGRARSALGFCFANRASGSRGAGALAARRWWRRSSGLSRQARSGRSHGHAAPIDESPGPVRRPSSCGLQSPVALKRWPPKPGRTRHDRRASQRATRDFDPRPREGGDRRRWGQVWPDRCCFDPRPQEGSDGGGMGCFGIWVNPRPAADVPELPALGGPGCCSGSDCSTMSKSCLRCEPSPRSGTLGARTCRAKGCQMMSGPFRSVAGFAPACSTLRVRFAPRSWARSGRSGCSKPTARSGPTASQAERQSCVSRGGEERTEARSSHPAAGGGIAPFSAIRRPATG